VLLAIGVIADARSNHPRLLIVRRHQTVGRSKRQALADTGTGDAWLSAPQRRWRSICPSVGPYAARVRPSAAAKPSPIQRPGLHDPARFLSDGASLSPAGLSDRQ